MSAAQQPSVTPDDIELAQRIVRDFRQQGWPAKEEEIARLLSRRRETSTAELRAELAEAKKQSEYRSRQWTHYEKLAMDFSSQEHMAKCRLQKAEAEIARLRGVIDHARQIVDDHANLYGDEELRNCADNILGSEGALNPQPKTEESQ